MRTKAIILTFIVICSSWQVAANSQPGIETQPPVVIPPPAQSAIPKEVWIENMKQTLPKLLCEEDQYFVQCFETTAKECIEFTQMIVEGCLNNVTLALPPQLSHQQKEHWGQMIGRCSYDLYEKFMQSKKRQIATCHTTSQTGENKPNKKEKEKEK